jgi:hypothetical protein
MLRGKDRTYVLKGGSCNAARVSNGLVGLLILGTKLVPLQSAHQFALFCHKVLPWHQSRNNRDEVCVASK